MWLDEWCLKNKIKYKDAAKLFGVSSNYLSQIINRKRRGSPTVAKRIIAATKGEVTYAEMYNDEPEIKKPERTFGELNVVIKKL